MAQEDTISTYEKAVLLKDKAVCLDINLLELQKFQGKISFLSNLKSLRIKSKGEWVVITNETYYELFNSNINLFQKYLPHDLHLCPSLRVLNIDVLVNNIPLEILKATQIEHLKIHLIDAINAPIEVIKLVSDIRKLKLSILDITGSKISSEILGKLKEEFPDIIVY